MIIDVLVTLILVFLNGFFVAAEFALVKIRVSQLEILAAGGKGAAKLALHINKNLDSYLSACQFGITLASLALGSVGEKLLEVPIKDLFHHFGWETEKSHALAVTSTFLSFGMITTLHIVFGEQAPKMLALQNAEKFTLAVAYPLRAFYFVFAPFIWLLNNFSNATLKVMGIYHAHDHETHSAQELELLIDRGKETGAIESGEHEIIKNAFGFDQITARQVMVPRPKINAIDIETPVDDIIIKIINEGYSRMPVYKDNIDNIEGVVYTKDLLRLLNKKEKIEFKDAMRPAYFVPETKKISELLRDLQKKRLHMAIVTDEYGGVSGIVTIEDIIEEIVGEIQDEHDDEAPIVEKVGDNDYVVNALSPIIDANEHLPFPLPVADEYDTVAGYVNMIFGKIPDLSDKISTNHYEIRLIKKSKQTVQIVKLTLINTPPPATKAK